MSGFRGNHFTLTNYRYLIYFRWIIGKRPARADIAGGWSDTPPISYEHGGAVTNAAILVDGKVRKNCIGHHWHSRTPLKIWVSIHSEINFILIHGMLFDINVLIIHRNPLVARLGV